MDIANNLALITKTFTHVQQKLNRLQNYSEQFGPKQNTGKTKTMKLCLKVHDHFKLRGEAIEDVEDFTVWKVEMEEQIRTQKTILEKHRYL